MDNFEEYIRQGEPNKAEKAKVWKTAIGLQQIDGLKPSDYLIVTAKQNIEGDITIDEVKQRIDTYYTQHPTQTNEDRTEEADKVSARIAEILSEQTFTFSPKPLSVEPNIPTFNCYHFSFNQCLCNGFAGFFVNTCHSRT